MTTKHTPGPWIPNNDSPPMVRDAIGNNIADTYNDSDARLIAAAPDLLAALIAFRDSGPSGGQDFAEWHASYRPAIALARAAIKRATGE